MIGPLAASGGGWTQATKEPGARGLKTIPADLIGHLQTKPPVSLESLQASEDRGVFMPQPMSLGALTTQPLRCSFQLWGLGYSPEQATVGELLLHCLGVSSAYGL